MPKARYPFSAPISLFGLNTAPLPYVLSSEEPYEAIAEIEAQHVEWIQPPVVMSIKPAVTKLGSSLVSSQRALKLEDTNRMGVWKL